jgi:hypothetical protein
MRSEYVTESGQVITQYTFAVCVKCGVQSPPVMLKRGEPRVLNDALQDMGWKFDRLRFNVLAKCPGCLSETDSA